jgi:hypothetical protein
MYLYAALRVLQYATGEAWSVYLTERSQTCELLVQHVAAASEGGHCAGEPGASGLGELFPIWLPPTGLPGAEPLRAMSVPCFPAES